MDEGIEFVGIYDNTINPYSLFSNSNTPHRDKKYLLPSPLWEVQCSCSGKRHYVPSG